MVTTVQTYLDTTGCNFTYDKGKNAYLQQVIREKLTEMSQEHLYIPQVYKETLRSVLNIFGRYSYLDGENQLKSIKCVHANPERAVAKAKEELGNLILPIISVGQPSTENSDDRRRYQPVLVQDKYWDEKAARAVRILSFSPRPVQINYSIGIWTKYKNDLDQILEQIRFSFNPSMEIPTKFSTLAKGNLLEETDSSIMEAADGEDRILKKFFGLQVETYIPSPKFLLTSTGKIERFLQEIDVCD